MDKQTTTAPTSTLSLLAHLLPFFEGLKGRYALGALLLLATNAAALLVPWLLKRAVEQLSHPVAAAPSANRYALLIALLAGAYCLVRIFSRTVILHGARLIEFRVREALFARLLELDQTFFFRERTGDLLSRFSNDLTNVRMLTGFGIMSLMNTVILYGSAVWLMVRINPLLTLAALAPLPLMVLTVQAVSGRIFTLSRETQEELARVSNHAEEAFSAALLIKSYCRETRFGEQFRVAANRCLERNLSLARLRGFIIPVIALATGAGILAVLYLGGHLVIRQAMTLGDFVAFSGYLALLVWPTMVLGWILTLFQRGGASMARINELLAARSAVREHAAAQRISSIKEEVAFRNLCFAYGERPVLRDISFTVAAGERIGITGTVGSGKSTLLQLIPRLLPASDGMIFLDGTDINQLHLGDLRSLIGYLPQEATLFSRTIAENIAYGGDGDCPKAAELAGLSSDLQGFTQGLDTLVGERGVTLSGGQRQRVALARALMRNPSLLLLDDPLAAVDAGHEDEILTALSAAWGGKTVLMVSHRLSAFRDCHRVLVLDDGRIVEQGTPAELLQLGGRYTELAKRQGTGGGSAGAEKR
ncbi:ABC transporter ATP-binding protein [Trichlorobacter ammonificans]|uniref:ATP-binding cassette, subfamily B n=1 Tax=Trichlorobacter ammonificans TaxID=2916410 RepID=A0ABM9D6C6_9BACT|nr:ABC transporter ATP-binding protein [Trichlorobacter ammonificans]CAH2029963.1 ATP-binding cassette, subfamily B [Trichlorobacter ammonificans]